ncbi:hypothetical protein N8Z07_03685 [Pelagibacteraceae bacterium]|nr:hypothetical protein [Pelagibacteraceae bacterium]
MLCFINLFKIKKDKNKKGFALILAMLVMLSLAAMSVAMYEIILKSTKSTVSTSQKGTVVHVAEFALEAGRLWLVDQLSLSGIDPITVINNQSERVSGNCLALHGYTDTTAYVYFANKVANVSFGPSDDANFGRYTYTYYVQRTGYHSTINGYNYIPQSTTGPETMSSGTTNNRRIFYRVIACGYGPDSSYIVPLQGYFSGGGDDPSGEANANLDARSLKSEGYFKP